MVGIRPERVGIGGVRPLVVGTMGSVHSTPHPKLNSNPCSDISNDLSKSFYLLESRFPHLPNRNSNSGGFSGSCEDSVTESVHWL